MMREADGTSPHLTESYATASYVANVEDGPHTQTTFRSRDPPHPLMATRMNWSLRAQSVQMTSSCVPMARSYQRQSMTDATLHHVRTEPIPATGIYFPVWGSGGNIVCVDDTSPPSWSQIAAKHTPCCELASVFRADVLLIHTKLACLSSKCRHKSFTNSIYSYKSYNINVNDSPTYYFHGHSNIAQGH